MRRVREKLAQRKTNEWADGNGILHTTLTLRGRRGWPDEVYWIEAPPLLIEFKAEGEEPRKLQLYIHKLLREKGYEVQVHTQAHEAIAAIKEAVARRRAAGCGALDSRTVPGRRRKVPA